MLRITVELISANDGTRQTLGVMDIANVSARGADSRRGNYRGGLYKKGTSNPNIPIRNGQEQRTGTVEDYPRLSYPVWRLVLRMLKSMYPEEK